MSGSVMTLLEDKVICQASVLPRQGSALETIHHVFTPSYYIKYGRTIPPLVIIW